MARVDAHDVWAGARLLRSAAAATGRPRRIETTEIVVHRIGGDYVDHVVDGRPVVRRLESGVDVERFYLRHPHGAATTQLRGTWQSKQPTIAEWARDGVPDEVSARAFVAYHLLVERDGSTTQALPMGVLGAHAPGVNSTSLAVGVVGDHRTRAELATWERRAGIRPWPLSDEQREGLRELLRDLLVTYPGAEIVTHDDVRRRRGQPPKPCPGEVLEQQLRPLCGWARTAARHVREGASRR